MKITILEGARGVGKSTIARMLRDGLTNTVLINMTGNNDNSEEGKIATFKHYDNLMQYLSFEKFDTTPFNFLFDRTFFSEQVYSSLYKDYNFTREYRNLLGQLDRLASNVEVKVILLITDEENLERNLKRDGKAHLFGDEKFADNLHKSVQQQGAYVRLIHEAEEMTNNIKYERVYLNQQNSLTDAVDLVKHIVNR